MEFKLGDWIIDIETSDEGVVYKIDNIHSLVYYHLMDNKFDYYTSHPEYLILNTELSKILYL
jgi:hypothetical protein